MTFTRRFWEIACDRAIRTGAQAALLTIGADQLDAFAADWSTIASMGIGGAVLSLLTSIAITPPEI